jgi:hypothetical protein
MLSGMRKGTRDRNRRGSLEKEGGGENERK